MRYIHSSFLLVTAGLVGCATPCDRPTDAERSSIGHGSISEMPDEVQVDSDGEVNFSFGLYGVHAQSWQPSVGVDLLEVDGELHPDENFGSISGYNLARLSPTTAWVCNPETHWWELRDVPFVLDGWDGDEAVPVLVFLSSTYSGAIANEGGFDIGIWEHWIPTTLVPATSDGTP